MKKSLLSKILNISFAVSFYRVTSFVDDIYTLLNYKK